jgi:hypothetical protein
VNVRILLGIFLRAAHDKNGISLMMDPRDFYNKNSIFINSENEHRDKA